MGLRSTRFGQQAAERNSGESWNGSGKETAAIQQMAGIDSYMVLSGGH